MKEVPSAVIVAMQAQVYEWARQLVLEKNAENDIRKEYEDKVREAESTRRYTEYRLQQSLEFLTDHNPDAVHDGDWFGEMGLEYLKDYDTGISDE